MIPIPSVLAAVQVSVTGWTVLAAFGFLAVFGNRISDLARVQQEAADPRAWIDDRIRTETHTGRRTAWRMIRDDHDLEGL